MAVMLQIAAKHEEEEAYFPIILSGIALYKCMRDFRSASRSARTMRSEPCRTEDNATV